MPKIKTRRTDILRPQEITETILKAEETGQSWLACVIAIAVIFGKRINEILSLKRDQVIINEGFLIIRFRVGKKRENDEPIPHFFMKRKTLKHPLTRYVTQYVQTLKDGYIFPFNRQPQTTKQTIKVKRKDGTIKKCEYSYTVKGGYVSRQLALYYLKKIAPDWWFHLCRETLATSMSEKGATEEELMHWFDWETPTSAHKYVKRGTKLTEKWSENIDSEYSDT